jgi:hypothetical protein
MAQLRDLYDLDNRITLWLDADGQKEREQPGSLTAKQLQERVMLQGRLAEIRDQVGTGMITDTWKAVSDETMRLRTENAGWQVRSPSLEAVYEFGKGKNPDDLLTHDDYVTFYGLFNASLNELQGLSQPDPLQKVRLQQLQVMRRDLMDTAAKVTTPPIRFSAATLYLRQMLKADQPLPTLFSMEPVSATNQLVNNPMDVLAYLRDIQLDLTVRYDPASQELKRAAAAMMNRVQAGEMSAQEARGHLATFHAQKGPVAFGTNPGANIRAGQNLTQRGVAPPVTNPSRQNLITKAQTLCNQVRTAFPTDADALGCRPVNTEYDAETVINTVCDRIRWSAPTVTPEQFNCPSKTV